MSDELRVILEVGPKRRVVAAAQDWPGLDRWGSTEEAAIEKLLAYLPRYAPVAERAGLGDELAAQTRVEVVERTPGSSSTDFWGIAHVPSQVERAVLAAPELERRLGLVQAGWAFFAAVAASVGPELRPGSRGGGRTLREIVGHVAVSEEHVMSHKVGVRTPREVVLTPEGLADHRARLLAAIRAYNGEGRPARSWPIQFLLRRIGQHACDHAWELQDRDPEP